MRGPLKLFLSLAVVLVFVSCATEPAVPPEEVILEPEVVQVETAAEVVGEPAADPLAEPGVAYFQTASGQVLVDGDTVTLPTGGPPAGRVAPKSDNPDVLLYVTRDGSKPSASNSWGGAISPGSALPITRRSEGTGTYSVVAQIDGRYSEPYTVNVVWRHEAEPTIGGPQFVVDGNVVQGSVTLPVSNGGEMTGRLYIECDYAGAVLFVTNDGTEPSADNYLYTQVAEGTYLYSPDAAEVTYRVVAIWQGVASTISKITVTWSE